jgi:hypothetical protein
MVDHHLRICTIRDLFWTISSLEKKTEIREEKIALAKLRKEIEFVSENLSKSAYKYKKKVKLSQKQIACIDRAEKSIKDSELYLTNNLIFNIMNKYYVN